MPIFEYENKKNTEYSMIDSRRVILQVESVQRQLEDATLFGAPAAPVQEAPHAWLQEEEDYLDTLLPADFLEEETGKYTMVSHGVLSRQGSLLRLTYQEELDVEEDAGAPVQVCLTFSEKECGPVTISRSGDMRTIFTVEQGVRQYSTYHTPYGQVDMCVIGKKIQNRISPAGGVLLLDYAVELQGMITQRTKMTIQVRPEEGEP